MLEKSRVLKREEESSPIPRALTSVQQRSKQCHSINRQVGHPMMRFCQEEGLKAMKIFSLSDRK